MFLPSKFWGIYSSKIVYFHWHWLLGIFRWYHPRNDESQPWKKPNYQRSCDRNIHGTKPI